MDDLIDRQAAIEALRDWEMCYDWDEHCREEPKEPWVVSPSDVVNKLPPIQPKRGKWIDGIIPNDSGGLPVIVCDQCNTFFPLQFGDGHNFCPNCGADMRPTERDSNV